MYGYKCEYCDGIVVQQVVKKEAFKHKMGFVIIEDVPIGICDKCGYRYYHSAILRRVEEVATGKKVPERVENVPVTHLAENT